MIEYELFKRDVIKMYLLNEAVNEKSTNVILYLESDGMERNLLTIRNQENNVYQFNNFVVAETVEDNCISFKPNVVGCPAFIKINSSKDIAIEVIRNGATVVDRRFDMLAGEIKIEFAPENYTKYNLYVNQLSSAYDEATIQNMANNVHQELHEINSDAQTLINDISTTTAAIEAAKEKKVQLQDQKSALSAETAELNENVNQLSVDIEQIEAEKKKLADDKEAYTVKLEKIKAEYDKDYGSYKDEIEEIKRNYNVDAEILKYYEDKDVTPIEELIEKAKKDIEQIEEQIRVFVDAKARKTAEIESELKLGKKE